MRICISGTPGTGKTTVSKLLGIDAINLNEFSREKKCTKGYDKKRRISIVDVECIKKNLKNIENVVIEGHFAHLLDCNITIVLRTSPKILRKRLEERNYSLDKIKENLEAEALGIITEEAMNENKDVYEIDTTFLTPENVADIIYKIIIGNGKEYRAGFIDYSEEILEWY